MKNLKKIDEFLDLLISNKLTPNFSLTIMKNNKVIYHYVNGFSDFGQNTYEVDNKTLFNLGSVTKTITASLIVKLAEKGLLTLRDPVKKYIKEYKFEEVTLLNLMTHTAGYDENLNKTIEKPKSKTGIDNYLQEIYSINKLKYSPNQACNYFTQGYSILMDVIQRITRSYIEEFAQNELFVPLDMHLTTFEPNFEQKNTYVLPWKKNQPDKFAFLKKVPSVGDSGLYSTSEEIIKFAGIFLNGGMYKKKKIFSQASIDMMLTETTNNRFSKTPVFWHRKNDKTGAFSDMNSYEAVCHPGFSGTLLLIDKKYDMAFSFITNSNDIHDDYSIFGKVGNVIMATVF